MLFTEVTSKPLSALERVGRWRSVAISHQPGGLPAGVFQLHFVERVGGMPAHPYQDPVPQPQAPSPDRKSAVGFFVAAMLVSQCLLQQ